MIRPNAFVCLLALALIAGFFGGWTVCTWRNDAAQLSAVRHAERREDRARDQGFAAGKGYADLAQKLAGARATDRTTIERIYQNAPPVHSDCAAPDAAVRVLEDGVRRANAAAAGQPVPALPTATHAAGSAD